MSRNRTPYSLLEVTLLLPNADENNNLLDFRYNVLEINFFENLHKPYIDARIAVLDDFGMKDTVSMQGTERIRIVIGNKSETSVPTIVKTFFISKINQTQKVNERSEILSIDLVEEHVYVNAIKQISRSYSETIEQMIRNLCQDEFEKPVVDHLFTGTAQGVRKLIVPYMSPLEAVQWIKTRATTRTGSPVFVYGDLYSNNLYLSDLDGLLSGQQPYNENLPLRYIMSASSVSDQNEQLRQYYEISAYRELNAENTMTMYEEGAIGSYYSSIDAGTGTEIGAHVTVRDIVDEFYNNELISVQSAQNIYDPTLQINGKLSDEYNSLHIHQVTSNKTYNQFLSIHDEAVVLDENNNIAESKLKVKNRIIRHILKRNTIEVGMDGALFFEGRIPVGTKLRVLFLNPDVNINKKNNLAHIDKKKSGDYLLIATNHKVSQESHTVVLRLTKLSELPDDFAL